MILESFAAAAVSEAIGALASSAVGAAGTQLIKTVLANRQDLARKLALRQRDLAVQMSRLNAALEGTFRVYHFRPGMPAVVWDDLGDYDSEIIEMAKRLRADSCYPPHGENRSHALAYPEDIETNQLAHEVRATRSDFATVMAMRSRGERPRVLSANVLLFDPQDRSLILHHRSRKSATGAGSLHFFGGNYEPPSKPAPNDASLHECALRELYEETRLKLEVPEHSLVLAGEETDTGFVQFTYVAVALGKDSKPRAHAGEGQIERYPIAAVLNYARGAPHALHGRRSRISPTGEPLDTTMLDSCLGTIVMWLLLGAPDEDFRTPWAEEAQKLGEEMLAALEVNRNEEIGDAGAP
ncbi:MAG: NUDIX domain-containing protein [Hyphomonadaceae bacterium]|nr:NUDIX domain-containing protein [Hyphomonadaceae bacterium]